MYNPVSSSVNLWDAALGFCRWSVWSVLGAVELLGVLHGLLDGLWRLLGGLYGLSAVQLVSQVVCRGS